MMDDFFKLFCQDSRLVLFVLMDLSLSDLGIFPLIFKGEIFFFSQQAIKLGWLPYLSSLDQGLSHAGDQYPVERYLLWDSHFQMMSPFTYSSHLFASPAEQWSRRPEADAVEGVARVDDISHCIDFAFFNTQANTKLTLNDFQGK